MKPLLIGEDNPYRDKIAPEKLAIWAKAGITLDLYPHPQRSAGYRLAVTILGLSRGEYLDRFDRVDLCGVNWSLRFARTHAARLRNDRPGRFILLGAKVAQAFDLPFGPFTERVDRCRPAVQYVILPHPSGRCRLWATEPDAIQKARDLVLR